MLTHSYNQNGAPPMGTAASETGSPARAELKTFIAATRRELQALSLALTQSRHEDAAAVAPPAPAAQPPASADPLHDGSAEPVANHAAATPLPAETAATQCHTLPTNDSPTTTHSDPVSEVDPLARLNAIKLRLAQQIQNAS